MAHKPDDPDHDYFRMLYCDNTSCLVNTFEHGPNGICPGCSAPGLLVALHRR